MTHDRVNPYAPRRTAPRLLQVLALAALATACLLAGGVTYQVTHLRGADISSAAMLLRLVGLLIVASVLLTCAGSGMREHDRRRILLAHQQAAADYARMMYRTAVIEREIFGEVLSYSVQEWLDDNRGNSATKPTVNPTSPTGGLKSPEDRSDIVSRLNAPLPDEVWLRYYRDHPEEPVLPEREHLRVAVEAARHSAAE